MNYYLIDYENVKGDGLSGCEKLTEDDKIIIFFTPNAKKVDMTLLADHGGAYLEMIEIPAGKQSADIHIGSYLGYLAGIHSANNTAKECKVIIVSEDSDYDNVLKFVKDKSGIKATKVAKISGSMPQKPKETKKSQNKTVSADEKKTKTNKKTQLNNEINKAVTKLKVKANVPNDVAKIVSSFYGDKDILKKVHNKLEKDYVDYQMIYGAVKPIIKKYQ